MLLFFYLLLQHLYVARQHIQDLHFKEISWVFLNGMSSDITPHYCDDREVKDAFALRSA